MRRLVATSLAALLLIVALLGPPGLLRAQELLPATVVGVSDGDTITVQFGDGARERVRLIGIDTPESVDPRRPVQCFGPEASQHTKELLEGKKADLSIDWPVEDDGDDMRVTDFFNGGDKKGDELVEWFGKRVTVEMEAF